MAGLRTIANSRLIEGAKIDNLPEDTEASKQDLLVSSINIKTINSNSILGGGNLVVGGGDMDSSTYDPTNVDGDAFDMDNMVEGTTTKILTDTERTEIATNTTKVGVTTEISNIVEDTTPQLGGELDSQANSIGFTLQTATGDGTTTFDFKLGNKIKFTFGAQNETFIFTAPSKAGAFHLILVQDATGSRTVTRPTIKRQGGSAPTLTTTANGIDIVALMRDGTNRYGQASLDFS